MNDALSCPSVYLECNVIGFSSVTHPDEDTLLREWNAMQEIWRASQQGKIRLVTCHEDTYTDIILWLNDQGCCITDTLVAMEAIDNFEESGLADQHDINGYRLVLDHCEQLESVPDLLDITSFSIDESGGGDEYTDNTDTLLLGRILRVLFPSSDSSPGISAIPEEDLIILRECLGNLQSWYADDIWRDLRSTDYNVNWSMLEKAFKQYLRQPVFNGPANRANRRLFGMLNRAVGLSKKSCPALPMKPDHINFIIDMVLKKYGGDKRTRLARHILHSIKHNTDCFITLEQEIVHRFHTAKEDIIAGTPYTVLNLRVVTPSEFKESYLNRASE